MACWDQQKLVTPTIQFELQSDTKRLSHSEHVLQKKSNINISILDSHQSTLKSLFPLKSNKTSDKSIGYTEEIITVKLFRFVSFVEGLQFDRTAPLVGRSLRITEFT